jgi:hypothetical protein
MCNLYTLKLSAWEVRNLMQHYKLIGREWEDVMGTRNDALEVYPNRPAPVVVVSDGQRIVRHDMLWGFPPFKAGAGYGTNFRTLNNHLWRGLTEHIAASFRRRPLPSLTATQVSRWSGVGSSVPISSRFSSLVSGGHGQAIEGLRRCPTSATTRFSRS